MITWETAVLVAFALAVAKAIEEESKHWGVNVPERAWLYLRALGTAAAVATVGYVPTVPHEVLLALSAVAAGLGVLGYWGEAQALGNRVKGR